MKFLQSVYIVFCLVVCFADNGACISSGTSVTTITGFTYQASVQCPVIMCSGAIISKKNVLTTATCVNGLAPTDVQVRVGSTQYYTGGSVFDIVNILQHPNFVPSTIESNLAILTTTAPFDFSGGTVQLIPPATAQPSSNVYFIASAYGAIDSSLTLPDYLQQGRFLNYPTTTCNNYKPGKLTASMFCAGDATGKRDFCSEDQGAPAVYNGQLVGIYSWGASCGLSAPNASTPVFNAISIFRNWIQSNVVA